MTEHDETPTMDVLEVVNTISVEVLNRSATPAGRVGVFLGMADLAFQDLLAAGCEPDTVSMALAPGTRKGEGDEPDVPVIVATFRAFKFTEPETIEEPTA